jgi:hypothetical protein
MQWIGAEFYSSCVLEVFDLRQNSSGWMRVDFRADAGHD